MLQRGLCLRADVGVFMFLAAELAQERVRPQRPLLVSLAKRVRAQLAESIGVLSTHVTVMPGTVPATWKKTRITNVNVVNGKIKKGTKDN